MFYYRTGQLCDWGTPKEEEGTHGAGWVGVSLSCNDNTSLGKKSHAQTSGLKQTVETSAKTVPQCTPRHRTEHRAAFSPGSRAWRHSRENDTFQQSQRKHRPQMCEQLMCLQIISFFPTSFFELSSMKNKIVNK